MSVMCAGPGAPAFFRDLSSCAALYLIRMRSKHSAPVMRQCFQSAPDRDKANNEECLTLLGVFIRGHKLCAISLCCFSEVHS